MLKPKLLNLKTNITSFLLVAGFCLLSSAIFAGFDFSTKCQEAQLKILDLRLPSARQMLSEERVLHPDNAYAIYLENFADIVELIVTDDEAIYKDLMEAYPIRFDEMDDMDDGSPVNGILQAEMLFYVGLAQVKYGAQLSGAAKIYNSYRRVKSHYARHPDYMLNLKMTGMFNIMMDFIPRQVRWITGILGVRGNSSLGMEQLFEYYDVVKGTPGKAQEAVLLINLAYKLTWEDHKGLSFLSTQPAALTDNVLAKYIWALQATFCFDNDLAMEKLNEADRRETETPFYPMYYLRGRCLLNQLDTSADKPLAIYLEEYPGEDFKKDACHRLSFFYLIKGDRDSYNLYNSLVQVVGQQLRDRDQEAMKESESGIIPHVDLLKARLLFDGGYIAKADSVMSSILPNSLNMVPYQLEYHYRWGRIAQMLGHTDEAIAALKRAAKDGSDQPYTFATRAALQLARIYEEQGEMDQALRWYNMCLEYFDEKHTVGSVEDMAEKGKKRVEGMK